MQGSKWSSKPVWVWNPSNWVNYDKNKGLSWNHKAWPFARTSISQSRILGKKGKVEDKTVKSGVYDLTETKHSKTKLLELQAYKSN